MRDRHTPPKERSLYRRLFVALCVTISFLCLLQLLVSVYEGRRFADETLQRLHWEVPVEWANDLQPRIAERFDPLAFDAYFARLGELSPGLAVYLVDEKGEIVRSAPAKTTLLRNRLPLDVIDRALSPFLPVMPFYGPDPAADELVPFAAASCYFGGRPGYLYLTVRSDASRFLATWDGAVHLAKVLLPAFLTITGGGIFVLWIFATYLSLNFKKLTQAARHFENGRYNERVPVFSDDEVGYLASSFNRMAASIVENEEQLKRIERDRRAMVANIAHDLRTPLTSIQGFLQTIAIRGDQIDPQQRRRFFSIIERSSDRQRLLLENLHALSGLDAQERLPERTSLLLGALAADVCASFEPAARDKSIVLSYHADPGDTTVFADQQMMERVVANLISNAIKYTPDGGSVSVRVRPTADGARFEVSDTGIGIPEEDLPQVFDDFFRVKQDIYENPGGTGLGLAIVRRMVELHGSRMKVASTLGAGTSFWFDLRRDALAVDSGTPTGSGLERRIGAPQLPAVMRGRDGRGKFDENVQPRDSAALHDYVLLFTMIWVIATAVPVADPARITLWTVAGAAIAFGRMATRKLRPRSYTLMTFVSGAHWASALQLFLPTGPDQSYPLMGCLTVFGAAVTPIFLRRSPRDVAAFMVPATVLIVLPFYTLSRYELYLAGVVAGIAVGLVLVLSFLTKLNRQLDRRFHWVFVSLLSAMGVYEVLQSTIAWRLVMTELDQAEMENVLRATEGALRSATSIERVDEELATVAKLAPKFAFIVVGPGSKTLVSRAAVRGRSEYYVGVGFVPDRLADEIRHIGKFAMGFSGAIPPGIAYTRFGESGQFNYIIGTNHTYRIAKRKVEECTAVGMCLAVIFVTTVVGFMIKLSSRRLVTQRFEQLVTVMQRLDAGDLSARVDITVNDEIDRIGKALNRMAEAMGKKIDALRASDQQRCLLIRAIAQTLREPLNAMQESVARMIDAESSLKPDTIAAYSRDVQKAVRAQYQLVEDLFEFSKLEVDELKLNPEPFGLGDVLQDAAMRIEDVLESKSLSLVLDMEEQIPFVLGDIGMISKTLEVLVEYAVLRTPEGGTVTVRCTGDAGEVQIRIEDGQGETPPLDLQRGELSVASGTEGLRYTVDCNPLRLALSRRFVELHGRRLDVHFIYGRGGSYGFRLDVESVAEEAGAVALAAA